MASKNTHFLFALSLHKKDDSNVSVLSGGNNSAVDEDACRVFVQMRGESTEYIFPLNFFRVVGDLPGTMRFESVAAKKNRVYMVGGYGAVAIPNGRRIKLELYVSPYDLVTYYGYRPLGHETSEGHSIDWTSTDKCVLSNTVTFTVKVTRSDATDGSDETSGEWDAFNHTRIRRSATKTDVSEVFLAQGFAASQTASAAIVSASVTGVHLDVSGHMMRSNWSGGLVTHAYATGLVRWSHAFFSHNYSRTGIHTEIQYVRVEDRKYSYTDPPPLDVEFNIGEPLNLDSNHRWDQVAPGDATKPYNSGDYVGLSPDDFAPEHLRALESSAQFRKWSKNWFSLDRLVGVFNMQIPGFGESGHFPLLKRRLSVSEIAKVNGTVKASLSGGYVQALRIVSPGGRTFMSGNTTTYQDGAKRDWCGEFHLSAGEETSLVHGIAYYHYSCKVKQNDDYEWGESPILTVQAAYEGGFQMRVVNIVNGQPQMQAGFLMEKVDRASSAKHNTQMVFTTTLYKINGSEIPGEWPNAFVVDYDEKRLPQRMISLLNELGSISQKAMDIILDAKKEIKLTVGDSFIDVKPGVLDISGKMVFINQQQMHVTGVAKPPPSPRDAYEPSRRLDTSTAAPTPLQSPHGGGEKSKTAFATANSLPSAEDPPGPKAMRSTEAIAEAASGLESSPARNLFSSGAFPSQP